MGVYYMLMKQISLSESEIAILCELFSETAALDMPISEEPEFDALWEKITND
tara:strand:- start:327 stop:482 length:156 start_codon:yes stop_codon:yes gene_type:complete